MDIRSVSRRLALLTLVITVSLFFGGCASVKIYDDDGKETGVRFYTAKPYLLVKRTGAKDKPIDVQVVHLPDLEHPMYAKVSSGVGLAKLSLKIANGTLSEFGGEGDSKATEFLNALTGGFKTIEEALQIQRTGAALAELGEEIEKPVIELYEILMTGGETTLRKVEVP